jgi:uncharacterized protein YbjT (DUF2867 family)
MNVVLFGATGMVGQGVLRACLADPGVERVLAIGRGATGQRHPKLRDVALPDVTDLSSLEGELAGYDACLFCLGVSSAGMSEARYSQLTYDLTLSIATTLARVAPGMTFVYVSGAGTDGTERGRAMWARVKGRTENALLRLPFRAAYMFRPGLILPEDGIRSRTGWYNAAYVLVKPLVPLLRAVSPNAVTTTSEVGRAMLAVGRAGYATPLVEMRDIRRLGAA